MKEKTEHFPFDAENEKSNPDTFTTNMNKNNSITYTQTKKLICDWGDKKNYLIHYKMSKLFVRHGMVVDKVHEKVDLNKINGWKNR